MLQWVVEASSAQPKMPRLHLGPDAVVASFSAETQCSFLSSLSDLYCDPNSNTNVCPSYHICRNYTCEPGECNPHVLVSNRWVAKTDRYLTITYYYCAPFTGTDNISLPNQYELEFINCLLIPLCLLQDRLQPLHLQTLLEQHSALSLFQSHIKVLQLDKSLETLFI